MQSPWPFGPLSIADALNRPGPCDVQFGFVIYEADRVLMLVDDILMFAVWHSRDGDRLRAGSSLSDFRPRHCRFPVHRCSPSLSPLPDLRPANEIIVPGNPFHAGALKRGGYGRELPIRN